MMSTQFRVVKVTQATSLAVHIWGTNSDGELWRITRVRHMETPEPSGCRWCGTGERLHASRFAPSVGQHLFAAPTSAQRLARMRARRASHH